jgi:CubicO group peptidase (beta-lactamase class C family)
MTSDKMLIWFSMTKAVTAVATAQMWEQGQFDLDDHVCHYIPEFGIKGKEAITIRHVLTHTGGFRDADGFLSGRFAGLPRSWEETIARICDAGLEPDWIPGKKAGYHPTSGWFILGELVRRFDGRPFNRYVREVIFEPLGMLDSWVGMPSERYHEYGDRIAPMHAAVDGRLVPLVGLDTEDALTLCIPGANGRGPIREFARVFEMLLFRGLPSTAIQGQREGARLLSPQTVEAITARHRVGMFDETFQAVVDWGLGLIVDSINYGRHCSPRTFGHGGGQSSVTFADPEQCLVVALVVNGMPGPAAHYRRFEAITTAIYEDLGLVEPGSPGRDHVMPSRGSA